MVLLQVIIAGVLGTILMTVFSHILSKFRTIEFKEPNVLNAFLSRTSSQDPINPTSNTILGWVVHFAIGVVLMTVFYLFHQIFSFGISFISILLFGILTGFLAILAWNILFYISAKPPNIDLDNFYLQLLVTHLIFATGAVSFIL